MSRFRNAVLSGPTPDGLRRATLYSPALKHRADLTLYLPEVPTGRPLPLIILLHGAYGSHWNWSILGNVHHTARQMAASGEVLPFAIAMPSDGLWQDGSGYLPHRDFDAEAWIIDDLPAYLAEFVPGVETARFYLAGQSMGGYGALRLGMKYADRVRAISAHSSITRIEDLAPFTDTPLEAYRFSGTENLEILHWAKSRRTALPPIRFDCGLDDPLLAPNRALQTALTGLDIPHTYEEHTGGHTWDYWQTHVRSTLRFFSQIETQETPR